MCETRLASSTPRTQCGTITLSFVTGTPQDRKRSVVHFTAAAAPFEPLMRWPMLSVRYDSVSNARDDASSR